jgi:hypothetical protein
MIMDIGEQADEIKFMIRDEVRTTWTRFSARTG